ncbi:hypothetical protein OAL71_01975 [Phycisphaerales bacterium]|nr:hypothetical protein [Phycisphaerales bacterium]
MVSKHGSPTIDRIAAAGGRSRVHAVRRFDFGMVFLMGGLSSGEVGAAPDRLVAVVG